MATQVSARSSAWLDGIAVNSQDLRLQQVSATLTSVGASGTTGIAATPGVRNAVGAPLAAVWTSGMTFSLNAGTCFVQGTASAIAGLWNLTLDTTSPLIVPASDPTNPRIDSVIAVVVDNGNGTSTAVFKILPGTPAGSPVAPTLPANALRLWNIAVAAATAVLAQVNFTDVRTWTVANGGILTVANAALGTAIAGNDGAYVDDLNTGRLRRIVSGAARAPKVAAVPPQTVFVTASVTLSPSTTTTIATTTITVDGVTELEITGFIFGFIETGTVAAGDNTLIGIMVDGAFFPGSNIFGPTMITASFLTEGCMLTAYVIPASGLRTITLVGQANVGAGGSISAFSANNNSQKSYLRVSASLA